MPLPVAVADTSVLIGLNHLGLLVHLSHLYRQVLIPAAVRGEFFTKDEERTREAALNLLTARGFFSPCDEFDSLQVELFRLMKMRGAEAEALSQLKVRNADVLLIDERIGTRIARKEMHQVNGTAGILGQFHLRGFIDFFEAIQRLRTEIKFRISDRHIKEVVQQLGIGREERE